MDASNNGGYWMYTRYNFWWQILTDRLSSGRAMSIALYSAVARKQKNELFGKINFDGDAVTD